MDSQRSAHLIKMLSPLFFPNASVVIGGDVKCEFDFFWRTIQEEAAKAQNTVPEVIFIRHPQYKTRTIAREFDATITHMINRAEPQEVLDDIDRLMKHYSMMGILKDTRVNIMPDTRCIFYNKTSPEMRYRILDFLRVWSKDVLYYSMREQLSVNVALDATNVSYQYVW